MQRRRIKGFQPENLDPVYNAKAGCDGELGQDPRVCDRHWQRQSDTAENDPLGHQVKPKNKLWNRVPTEEERALAEGWHQHSDPSNPLGLHKHIPDEDEPLGGGHTHALNSFGTHTHKGEPKDNEMFSTSGHHIHKSGENWPSGKHIHPPEDFSSKSV